MLINSLLVVGYVRRSSVSLVAVGDDDVQDLGCHVPGEVRANPEAASSADPAMTEQIYSCSIVVVVVFFIFLGKFGQKYEIVDVQLWCTVAGLMVESPEWPS